MSSIQITVMSNYKDYSVYVCHCVLRLLRYHIASYFHGVSIPCFSCFILYTKIKKKLYNTFLGFIHKLLTQQKQTSVQY